MATQVLKDNRGFTIGRIEESGGKLTIKDERGFKKGSYDPKSDTTFDDRGHTVGKGNLLMTLLNG